MKVKTLDVLEKIVEKHKLDGKKVVLCHGVFDLFHLGHLIHLKEAKKFGDILIVTLTPDEFVNKGPNRPVFKAKQRAELIASLEVVDYVAINEWDTSINTILKLKPNSYVKGNEFRDKSDIDGAVLKEKEVIESIGGTMEYTSDDVVYSSSNLINNLNYVSYPPETDAFLKEFRKKYHVEQILSYLEKIKDSTVLVIGDLIIDEYVYGNAIGKSSKDPTLVIQETRREKYAGGALAVANHLSGFCKKVILVSTIGNDEEEFIQNNLKPNIERCFFKRNAPTTIKQRFIDEYSGNKLLEVYKIDQQRLENGQEKIFIDLFNSKIAESDLLMVSDFGHGLMEGKIIQAVCSSTKRLSINAQCNAGNLGYNFISKYPRGDMFIVDEKELRMETRDRFSDTIKLLAQCFHNMNCESLIVTRGSKGSETYTEAGISSNPALAINITDRVGAGDSFFALASLAFFANAPPEIASFLGNVAGSLNCKVVGNKKHIDAMDFKKTVHYLMK